ncbi:hypothetical protein COL5a_002709 [Colletotrichum fioriniae]|uniref:Uncharacterized protein n=1 Tax=Colletotrichum fioriniae PJ7 TaxID=1445577 RepID=A0A010RFY6_9PEZI|nr:uncharacterized protein COL516b_005015 [Colletotrichum fioriniae]EXF79231.1 hypothetical protein CFIO01_05019 [Colletotrichum fioriniae PJ7]KAJ0305907.1 hypothetical protein COL516b_005015 [Colletotrichum fioriniae]KAJ0331176.1 hypothetical protein COL5a_002709 [Colletotrichum fioriniae]
MKLVLLDAGKKEWAKDWGKSFAKLSFSLSILSDESSSVFPLFKQTTHTSFSKLAQPFPSFTFVRPSMSLPFPTSRFGPGFTVPTAVTVTEGGRTVTFTPTPTGGTTSDSSPFPDNILQQSGLAPGQIIGITVGATSGLVFFVVALVWFWNRRRARKLAARDEALDTVMEDPEKPDDAAMMMAQNTGETVELPAPRVVHEMPETREGPPVELPAPVERHEMPA